MKAKWKQVCALILCLALLVGALTACGGSIDASAFTEQALSARFTGESDESYKELANLNDTTAEEAYEQVLQDEADYFAEYFDINLELCSEETRDKIVSMYRTLLAKASYQVGVSTPSGEGYLVSVTIAPMDIVQRIRDEKWDSFQQDWIGDYADLYEMDEQELEQTWADRILEMFDGYLSKVDYLEEETISIQITRNDGAYVISDTDIQRIDTLVIKY